MMDELLGKAELCATLQSVVAYDINHLMPKPDQPRFNVRPEGAEIDRVLVHHSGALGRAGVDGAIRSAEYVFEEREKPFGALPYHWWIPRFPLHDDQGRLVVLRCAPDEERCWHTGGKANDTGIGVVLQGNTTSTPLTIFQRTCLNALLLYLEERHKLPSNNRPSWLGWHSIGKRFGANSNKARCPGRSAEKFLKEWLKLSDS